MIRAQGIIQEVGIRIIGAAVLAAALYGCSQSGQSPATAEAALDSPATQSTEMAEVVISTSRPPRPRG